MEINVNAELERYGIAFNWDNQDNVKILCPFHPDERPSCSVNIKSGEFKCFVCNNKGDFVNLLARKLNVNRVTIITDLSKRYELDEEKLVDPELIQRYHAALLTEQGEYLRSELYKRGLNDDLIRYYRLGMRESRITIPVQSSIGNFVNLLLYLPGAKDKKVTHLKGYGKKPRLYPYEQLQYDTLVLCGGAPKAIVAAYELNRHGIGAVCSTHGETNWYSELVQFFTNKRVIVMLDIDKPGQRAAISQAMQIRSVAKWVGNVVIPLDTTKYPKGDINNWVADEKQLLKPLIDSCEEFVPQVVKKKWEINGKPPEEMPLLTAIHADHTAKRIKVTAVASMLDTAPYIVPREIEVLCNEDEKCCSYCPVRQQDSHIWDVPPESPAILDFITSTKNGHFDVARDVIGIPAQCHKSSYQANAYFNVDDVRISPRLEITNKASDNKQLPAYCIGVDGKSVELNESYNLTGRMFPHPKSQQATLLVSNYEQTQDSLSTFKLNDIEDLTRFWPTDWSVEAIQSKLDEIYADLEANVTRIFERRDMHLYCDLAYHSALAFKFDSKLTKGWVEVLIVGDSSQGKSETAACMHKHYGLGEIVECKNATIAGLLGGAQKNGERWWISWGIIPNNDKRLVILEELKGTSIETIGKLTGMRSSGVAEIPKIEKKKANARTRLIGVSNPRPNIQLARYNFGLQALVELIGGLEDLRRFDACLLVSEKEVDQTRINQTAASRPQIEHQYTNELCRKLVLWCWTRTAEQVVFTEAATAAALHHANRLCEKFTSDIPIVDKGSMRLKLARLAVALAGRLFSCSEDYETLIVEHTHVEYIASLLDRVYSSPTFGYLDYTKAVKLTQEIHDENAVVDKISATPYPSDLIKSLLATNKVDSQDLQDWCAYDREQALELLSLFVRKHCLIREGRNNYRKTAPFIELLKNMLENGRYSDCPDFVPTSVKGVNDGTPIPGK